METYYIYEIPGVKIGCTVDPERRQKEQISKGEMIILETYTDLVEASERERELQLERGYGIDGNSYVKQMKLVRAAQQPDVIKRRTLNHDYKAIHEKGAPKRKKYFPAFKKYNESRKIKIEKYSLDNELLFTYESIKEAAKDLNVVPQTIHQTCIGLQKTCRGFILKKKKK